MDCEIAIIFVAFYGFCCHSNQKETKNKKKFQNGEEDGRDEKSVFFFILERCRPSREKNIQKISSWHEDKTHAQLSMRCRISFDSIENNTPHKESRKEKEKERIRIWVFALRLPDALRMYVLTTYPWPFRLCGMRFPINRIEAMFFLTFFHRNAYLLSALSFMRQATHRYSHT